MKRKSLMVLSLITLMMMSLLSWIPSALASVPESEWWMYRPSEHVYIDHHVENASTNDEASVGIGVFISSYQENSNDWPFLPERDGLIFRVAATANTRKGITYTPDIVNSLIDWIDLSSLGSEYIVTTDDDGGRWIDLPFVVRFYGGPGCHPSAEYEKVWVCSNGFLSFDSKSNSSDPKPILNSDSPNTLLAVYWSDLDPSGGWIKYYIDETHGLFVVEWYKVLNKNNEIRQTFEVIIWNSWDPILWQRGQDEFAFLYQSVTWDESAVGGIEDQEGYKGIQTGGLSGQSIYFQVEKESAEIRRLKIVLEKSDDQAEIWILEDPKVLKGTNLQSSGEEPAPPWFEEAFSDLVTLLASTVLAATIGPSAGLMFETSVIGLEFVSGYVHEFSPFKYEAPDVKDANTTENEAHVYAKAEGSWGWPVDASLGSQIYWVFTDDSTRDHSIKITATLEYCYYNTNHEIFTDEISTSVNLSMDLAPPSTPSKPRGPTSGSTGTNCCYRTNTTDPYGHDIRYEFDWGDGTTTLTDWNVSGAEVSACHTWTSTGTYHVKVRAQSRPLEPYGRWSDWSPILYVSIGGGGGGCPFVSTWNGYRYVIDNNLLPASEWSDGDVEDYYRLEQALVPKYDGHWLSWYSLQISEFEHEHSYFDQVKLMAVDHESDVNVAVSPYGDILTYSNPTQPMIATNMNGEHVTDLIGAIDGDHYQGYAGDYLTLDFGSIDVQNGAKLVIRSDTPEFEKPPKSPIYIQTLNSSRIWNTVAIIYTRIHWSTDVIDLSEHLPDENGEFKVRLQFVSNDKVDFVGLDKSEQDDFEVHHTNLISAIHSTQGCVLSELLFKDNYYTELVPDEHIKLTFTLPKQDSEARTFVIYAKGHYYTIS